MKNIITREYQPSDVKPLADIFYQTIHKINSRDYSEEQINAWAPTPDIAAWQNKWDKIPPIVATYSNVIAGFAEFERNGHIDCFYVHHEYQNCGIGKALMNAISILAYKYDCEKIFAEVSITAKPFFERRGFVIVQEQIVNLHGVKLINFRMEKNIRL